MTDDRTNAGRAADAALALNLHSAHTGILGEPGDTQLTDILCNLMHWCAANGVVWNTCLERADDHHFAEWDEEEQAEPVLKEFEVIATADASYSASRNIKAINKTDAQAEMLRRIGEGNVVLTCDDVPLSPAEVDLFNITEVISND